MITKDELLDELNNNTFVMLRPSKISGVGVFAIRDIPKGCREMFSKPETTQQWITIPMKEVERLPAHSRDMIYNYCLFDDENYYVQAEGFKKMDLSHYLNHSDSPNVTSISDGDFFETLRDIKAGEELLIDYGTIVDSDE